MHLPPTILIDNGEPKLWFQSVRGHLRKKKNTSLEPQLIIDALSKGSTDVVALFVEAVPKGGRLCFEYFDRAQLEAFFERSKGDYNLKGYLQKFVRGKGESNQVIKAHWSPNLFLA